MNSNEQQSAAFKGIKRILMMKLKHIGDVLLMTPSIRALHEAFPGASIDAFVNEGTEQMLEGHPLLGEILVFPRSRLRQSMGERIRWESAFIRKLRSNPYDMLVDFTSSDRPAWYSLLGKTRYHLAYDPCGKGFPGKKWVYSHCAPHPTDPNIHEVKKNLGILEAFQIQAKKPKLELHLTPAEQAAADSLLRSLNLSRGNFVLAHPTSRWLFKCWDDSRFAALVDWLQFNLKIPVLVTCGPDEKELKRAQSILNLCKSTPSRLLGKVTLREWAALARQARLFIGVDSAPMHIAASQEIPSVVFFGPTGHHNWHPWEVKHTVLVKECPCSRDREPHCDWKKTRACMTAITLDEAQNAIQPFLS